jgi:hypothetical protein
MVLNKDQLFDLTSNSEKTNEVVHIFDVWSSKLVELFYSVFFLVVVVIIRYEQGRYSKSDNSVLREYLDLRGRKEQALQRTA